MDARKSLSGWGRTASSVSRVVPATSEDQRAELVRGAGPPGVLARGLGRSYGDAALNAGGVVLDLTGRKTLGAIDADTGAVTVDAGVSVDGLLRTCVPEGWFVPVTPGTRYVTVGGAISSDIHGKDHPVQGSLGSTCGRSTCSRGRVRSGLPSASQRVASVLRGLPVIRGWAHRQATPVAPTTPGAVTSATAATTAAAPTTPTTLRQEFTS